MHFNTEYYIRRQKEKALGFYSVHTTSPVINGKYSKSRTKFGAYVAWPKTEAASTGDETRNFSSS